MALTGQDRTRSPGPQKTIYFEKSPGAGVVLRCQVVVVSFGAFVYGDENEIATGFSGVDGESQAVKYVEALGYVQAIDWQLPPPMR
jgi:hypothetical protein